jgi:hypothetical protein
MREHDAEPVRGLPERLPAGERILWQGAPRWNALARRAFHARKVAIYFGLLVAWTMFSGLHDGEPVRAVLVSAAGTALLGALAVGLLIGLAWICARTTMYTITNRRIVMRIGMALSLTLNVPFRIVRSADLRRFPDGTGDIPLALGGSGRIGWLNLWPHVRPWSLKHPQPTFRAVAEADRVAELLGKAIAAGTGTSDDAADASQARSSQRRGERVRAAVA